MKIQNVQTYPLFEAGTSQGKNENGTNRNNKGHGELLWLVKKPAKLKQKQGSFEELLRSEFQAQKLPSKPAGGFGEYISGQKPPIDELDQRAIDHLHEFWA